MSLLKSIVSGLVAFGELGESAVVGIVSLVVAVLSLIYFFVKLG